MQKIIFILLYMHVAVFFCASDTVLVSATASLDDSESPHSTPIIALAIVPIFIEPIPQITVITFGTYDLFHRGHLEILRRAKALGTRLVVGVSTDAFNMAKKSKKPCYSQEDRCEIVAALKFVDEVFLEESMEQKGEYIDRYHADIVVMGDDWAGRFDEIRPSVRTVYFPRTRDISTTLIIETIGKAAGRS